MSCSWRHRRAELWYITIAFPTVSVLHPKYAAKMMHTRAYDKLYQDAVQGKEHCCTQVHVLLLLLLPLLLTAVLASSVSVLSTRAMPKSPSFKMLLSEMNTFWLLRSLCSTPLL